ncbi:MAG: hypothetical protein RIR97_1350 [Pseudomonadota bacterium]
MTVSDQNMWAEALFPFDNSFARMPAPFQLPQLPTKVAKPRLIKLNTDLAFELGLDPDRLQGDIGAQIFSGNDVPEGAAPLAMAYAAHQFGNFVPQLGDGRAILLGEVVDRHGRRRDIQLKGAGPTPFSRRGDGRAALGPVLREYLVSEAMHALHIPTTRALAAVTTGEPVYRQVALPGGVITRVAASHIRIGTFQYFAARQDPVGLQQLADYVIDRHYTEADQADNAYVALLDGIVGRQAKLIAQWMGVGFIHGVMNTDNMTVSGETIDFGPCAFMDVYDPATVYSSIDQRGRYAYKNQPPIAQWNLARLAETMLFLLGDDSDQSVQIANDLVVGFGARYQAAWLNVFRKKIGLSSAEEEDQALIEALLELMHRGQADFTNTFRRLSNALSGDTSVRDEFLDREAFDVWKGQWLARLWREPTTQAEQDALMRSVNPAFIPRNHRIEAVIEAAVDRDDFQPFETLNAVLSNPFDDQPEFEAFRLPPRDDEKVMATFCGT